MRNVVDKFYLIFDTFNEAVGVVSCRAHRLLRDDFEGVIVAVLKINDA